MCNTDTICFRLPEIPSLYQYLYLDPANAVPYRFNGRTVWVSIDTRGQLLYEDPKNPEAPPAPLDMSVDRVLDIIQQLKDTPAVKQTKFPNRWAEIKQELCTPITLMLLQAAEPC